MKTFFQTTAILGIVALSAFGPSAAPACTGITIKPKDGSIIFARTLEFGMDLKSNILIVPRGKEFIGTAPDRVEPGKKHTVVTIALMGSDAGLYGAARLPMLGPAAQTEPMRSSSNP